MTVNLDRLEALESITLDHGSHPDFETGHCAMEVVSWLADEGHTDAPQCASTILRHFTITLNDRWYDEQRQTLKPFLPRMVGTGSDGKDDARRRIAAEALCMDLLLPWLRLAGLDEHAALIEGMAGASYDELSRAIRAARDAGWEKRQEKRRELEVKVREHLASKSKTAADADAVAAAAADGGDYWTQRNAAYKAARAYYREHPLPVIAEAANLAQEQQGKALELLDRLIEAQA